MRYVYFLFLVATLFVYGLAIPPFQKPDEILHFEYVLRGVYRDCVPSRYGSLSEKMMANKIAFKSEVRFNKSLLWQKDESTDCQKSNVADTLNFWWLRYPHVLFGVKLGELVPYPVISIYLSRLMGGLVLVLGLFVSTRINSVSKYLLALYGLLPMVWHQATSVSYDVVPLALVPVILSLMLKLVKARNISNLLMLLLLCVWWMLAKEGYYVIGLVVIMSSLRNFVSWRIRLLLLGLMVAVGLWLGVGHDFGDGVGLNSPMKQIEIIKSDPLYLIEVFGNTWVEQRNFLLQGILGYFGWLDYQLDYSVLVLLVLVAGYFIYKSIDDSVLVLGRWELSMLIVGVLMQLVLLELMIYIHWVPMGRGVIDGAQGRYFLVLVPFVVLAMGQLRMVVGKMALKKAILAVSSLLIVLGVFDSINKRYFDFSGRFGNDTEMLAKLREVEVERVTIINELVDKKITFYVGTNPDDEIRGFDLYFDSHGTTSRVPYRYLVKDSDCNKTHKIGYLDQEKLVGSGVIREEFSKGFKPKEMALCVVLLPVVSSQSEQYISIGRVENNVLFNFLFQERTQEYK